MLKKGLHNGGKNPHYSASNAQETAIIKTALDKSGIDYELVNHTEETGSKSLRFFISKKDHKAVDSEFNDVRREVSKEGSAFFTIEIKNRYFIFNSGVPFPSANNLKRLPLMY